MSLTAGLCRIFPAQGVRKIALSLLSGYKAFIRLLMKVRPECSTLTWQAVKTGSAHLCLPAVRPFVQHQFALHHSLPLPRLQCLALSSLQHHPR